MPCFRAKVQTAQAVCLELRSGKPCESTEEVLVAAEAAGIEAKQISAFIDFKYGRNPIPAADLPKFYDAFMRSVSAAAALGETR